MCGEKCGASWASWPPPWITPACAGKSIKKSVKLQKGGDHPRVCGEKCWPLVCTIWFTGSPPRVRGKGALDNRNLQGPGITPACAGKSVPLRPLGVVARDHPRVCGEKHLAAAESARPSGSPPRVRGKVCTELLEALEKRITPACAGKSSRICIMRWIAWDHPRVCGEKTGLLDTRLQRQGSPPRVRGKEGKPNE